MLTGYQARLSKPEFPQEIFLETTQLLQQLVHCYPVYASEGLSKAQKLLKAFLEKSRSISIFQDVFYAQDISHLASYIDVTAFGPIYQHYVSVEKSNLVAILDSGLPGKTLILNGHIDVDFIDPDVSALYPAGEILDDSLYGRGSADMLGGLTALAAIFKYFSLLKNWKGRLIFTAVTDEEIGGNGTLRALEFLKARALLPPGTECLIAEPSNGICCLSSMGFLHIQLIFQRTSSHMGAASKDNNAIWDLNRFLNDIESIFSTLLSDDLIYSFGIVHGGTDAAIPLGKILLEGTIFFPPSLSAKAVEIKVKESIFQYRPEIKVKISDFRFEGANFEQSTFHSLLSRSTSTGIFPSPCDARLFKSYGIPTVIYGPGRLREAHSPHEFLCLKDWRTYISDLSQMVIEYMQ